MPVGDAPRPLPWKLVDEGGDEVIRDGIGGSVHCDTTYYPSGLALSDAAYIVAAVNAVRRYELALAVAQRRFNMLAVVSDEMVNGVRPSIGAAECAAAIGHQK